MSKIVEKKWYSGNLELDWGPNVPDQLRSATETYPRKCLVQNGKNHTIRMTLADLNNLITLQHLRKGRVRVFGRLAKQSHSHPGSNKRYYLETEQIQVEGDESSLSRDMSSGGGTERKFSLRSGDFTFIGVLVSFGPVLATPVEIPQRQTPQPQQDAPSTTMGTASRSGKVLNSPPISSLVFFFFLYLRTSYIYIYRLTLLCLFYCAIDDSAA